MGQENRLELEFEIIQQLKNDYFISMTLTFENLVRSKVELWQKISSGNPI